MYVPHGVRSGSGWIGYVTTRAYDFRPRVTAVKCCRMKLFVADPVSVAGVTPCITGLDSRFDGASGKLSTGIIVTTVAVHPGGIRGGYSS